MQSVGKFILILAGIALVICGAGLLTQNPSLWKPGAAAAAVGFGIGLGAIPALRGYRFTMWIIAAVTVAMIYPEWFRQWGGIKPTDKRLVLVVIQLVMFGMGTQMSIHDFVGVAKAPRGVLVGILCHFSVMPLVGYGLTKVFTFEPEIAAGIILIGSCSSGLASNVMAYIARSNLALSVTVTAITTMVAPLLTPALMQLLAGSLLKEMKFLDMMVEIVKTVIVPIGAALLHDYLKFASPAGRALVRRVAALGAVAIAVLCCGGWAWLAAHCPPGALLALELTAFALGAVLFGLAYHEIAKRSDTVVRWMPAASMAGIVYFTTVTTAAGRDRLLQIGFLLFLVSVLHNAAGYFFGYWLSRAAGLDKNSCRSVAFEVGLQNGGMATTLANSMGKLGTVGLAAAIFSPWMNVSGSILANYWKRRPVAADPAAKPAPAS